MSEWQPIETAPKDGTPFLAWCPVVMGVGDSDATPDAEARVVWWETRGQFTSDRDLGNENFTHWTPLPAPPTDQKEVMPNQSEQRGQSASSSPEHNATPRPAHSPAGASRSPTSQQTARCYVLAQIERAKAMGTKVSGSGEMEEIYTTLLWMLDRAAPQVTDEMEKIAKWVCENPEANAGDAAGEELLALVRALTAALGK